MKITRGVAKLCLRGCALILCCLACAWASGPKTTVLYKFTGSPDGRSPNGQLIADQAGNLYGTTEFGGTADHGVVFELSPPTVKGGQWTEKIIYRFQGGSDGTNSISGLIFDRAGNLYGTTFDGGRCQFDCGVVFRLSPPKNRDGAWTETVLHAFGGVNSSDGGGLSSRLVFDQSGNLYGTTQTGGSATCTNFPGACGVVFQLSPPKSHDGPWTENVLYNFTGVPDGAFPFGNLTMDQQGNLFGGTTEGGTGACTDGEGVTIGCGTAFELSPLRGGGWKETVLYNFQTSDSGSLWDLFRDSTGSLFGPAGYDVVRLVPPVKRSDSWTQQKLHQFPGGLMGRLPSSGVVSDPSGNFYGTAWANAIESRYGLVYKLSPPTAKSKKGTVTTLHRFPGNFDSEQPKGLLFRSKSGDLYGTTSALSEGNGYVFKITP